MSVRVSLIVAVAENGVIGLNNKMPWHLPEDLKHFKRVTMGKPIIMGRKTFESIGTPLPGRHNIVISRAVSCASDIGAKPADNLSFVTTVDQALQLARTVAQEDGVDEIMVVGGAEIYRQTLEISHRIYRTLVEIQPEGDAYFTNLNREWELVAESSSMSTKPKCRFQTLEKI